MRDRIRLLAIIGGWIAVVAGLLSVINAFSFELFYVLSFLGFLVIVELFVPTGVTVGGRRAIEIFTVVGLLGFLYFIYKQLLTILPPGVI